MLPRGYELLPECHVKRQIATGKEWCIYQTSMKTYALVASSSAVSAWQQEGCGDIFKALSEQDTYAFVSSSPDYLIASLNDGPFPENSAQIEAFSTTLEHSEKRIQLPVLQMLCMSKSILSSFLITVMLKNRAMPCSLAGGLQAEYP